MMEGSHKKRTALQELRDVGAPPDGLTHAQTLRWRRAVLGLRQLRAVVARSALDPSSWGRGRHVEAAAEDLCEALGLLLQEADGDGRDDS
jgi:hypothetical protein